MVAPRQGRSNDWNAEKHGIRGILQARRARGRAGATAPPPRAGWSEHPEQLPAHARHPLGRPAAAAMPARVGRTTTPRNLAAHVQRLHRLPGDQTWSPRRTHTEPPRQLGDGPGEAGLPGQGEDSEESRQALHRPAELTTSTRSRFSEANFVRFLLSRNDFPDNELFTRAALSGTRRSTFSEPAHQVTRPGAVFAATRRTTRGGPAHLHPRPGAVRDVSRRSTGANPTHQFRRAGAPVAPTWRTSCCDPAHHSP
jgi:hypothetical protein